MPSVSPSPPASDVTMGGAARSADHRLGAAVAWVGWLVAVVSGSAGAWYTGLDQATGHQVIQQSPVSGIAGAAIAAAYGTVGLLLVLRRPRLVVAWLFLAIGVVSGLSNLIWGYVGLGLTTGEAPGPLAAVHVAWLNNVLTYPIWVALAVLLVLLFPDGRPLDRRWRWVSIAVVVDAVVLGLALAIEPGPMRLFALDNPMPGPAYTGPIVAILIPVAILVLCSAAALSLWGLAVRYRRSGPIERRQLKWFAWGSVLTLAGGGVLVVASLAVAEPGSRLTDLSWVIFAAASITLPVAALIAILREGLYDIDRLISRTFVYGLLTAILAGVYTASIRLFNALFVGLTGQSNELALVLTTLMLATTFTPIKFRLEHVAQRRLGSSSTSSSIAASDPVETAVAAPEATSGQGEADELDRRIEAIARRVALEVLARSARPEAGGHGAGRSARRTLPADGPAEDHEPDQDQDERPEQVADAGEPRPQA